MESAALANLQAVDHATNNHYAALVVDKEILHVTAHAAGATTATVQRGQEGTAIAAHDVGAAWRHGPTEDDWAASAQVEAIIKSGTATVANNVLPPGLRIPERLLVRQAYVRLGTAPTGTDFIVEFNKNGTLFATVTVPAGVASGSATGLSEQFVAGDVLTWDITQVGSSTAGSDVAAAVFGALG